jgi:hypothetical protein
MSLKGNLKSKDMWIGSYSSFVFTPEIPNTNLGAINVIAAFGVVYFVMCHPIF